MNHKIGWYAVFIAIGMALGGWFVGRGFVPGRTADRYVTVKGVSERDVVADLALWPLQLVGSADELVEAQSIIDRSVDTVMAFLSRHSVDTTLVEVEGIEVTDRVSNQFGPSDASGPRYVVAQRLMVRSDDPHLIHRASQSVGELIAAGVVLRSGTGWGPAAPTFLFKGLNALKPSMIAEATAAAREAAAQFATDADSQLGGVRRANQGVFVILPRDAAQGVTQERQLNKTVRVVSTIEYYLQLASGLRRRWSLALRFRGEVVAGIDRRFTDSGVNMAIISVTRLRVRSIRYLLNFMWYARRSATQAKKAPGNVGTRLRKTTGLTFWTLTSWQDQQSMATFRAASPHRDAMPKLQHWCDEAAVANWEQDSPELPSWE